jgi:hypothetical protein
MLTRNSAVQNTPFIPRKSFLAERTIARGSESGQSVPGTKFRNIRRQPALSLNPGGDDALDEIFLRQEEEDQAGQRHEQ